MMFRVTAFIRLLAVVTAIVPNADIQHPGPMVSEGASMADFMASSAKEAKEAQLAEEVKEAERKVHEAAAAARKTANGDGSDSFANSLEKSMMALEEEDHENQEKAKQRREERKIEREVKDEITHANLIARQRAASITPEAAADEVIKTAENIREASPGDASASWASELEESVIDLEEEKRENDEKAKERRARHQHDHEVREELLHARQAAHDNAHRAPSSDEAARQVQEATAAVQKTAHGDGSDSWANHLEESVVDLQQEKHEFEEKEKERRAKHALEAQVREELLHAEQPQKGNDQLLPQFVGTTNDESSNADIVQSFQNVVLFFVFAAILGVLVWWKKFVNSASKFVHVPGIGKINMVRSERMVMGLFAGSTPNASLDVYDTGASAPLKASFAGPKQGYGVFSL